LEVAKGRGGKKERVVQNLHREAMGKGYVSKRESGGGKLASVRSYPNFIYWTIDGRSSQERGRGG